MAEPKPVMRAVPGSTKKDPRGKVEVYPKGSDKLAGLVEAGYEMSKEEAEIVVKEYEADSDKWPFEYYRKAKAFVATLNADPKKLNSDAYDAEFARKAKKKAGK